MTMQDYNSRLSDPASRKFETFSYLPAMTKDEIAKTAARILITMATAGRSITSPAAMRLIAASSSCRITGRPESPVILGV